MALESKFQSNLVKKIKQIFPEAIIMKEDACQIQGVPDLIILNGDQWASLECKKSVNASHRPNQDYYVNKMNSMSFSRFIYPENEKEVLQELCDHFNN